MQHACLPACLPASLKHNAVDIARCIACCTSLPHRAILTVEIKLSAFTILPLMSLLVLPSCKCTAPVWVQRRRMLCSCNVQQPLVLHITLCVPYCRRLIEMRNPHVDPINVMQVEILRRLRSQPDNQQLRDALLLTINGVAAGMRNTG
jgi:hypothetical protein